MPPVKLHRCSLTWLRLGLDKFDACWRVQHALDDAGIEYEVVKVAPRRSQRPDVEALTGQTWVPVIEFEDGTGYRAQSKDMAERIRAGKLFEEQGQATASGGDGGEQAPPEQPAKP